MTSPRCHTIRLTAAVILLLAGVAVLYLALRSFGPPRPEGQLELSRVWVVGYYVENGRLMLFSWQGDWVPAAKSAVIPVYWDNVRLYRLDTFVGNLPVPAPWFAAGHQTFERGTGLIHMIVPAWLILLLVAPYPVVVLGIRPLSRRRRKSRGQCISCGYNLTGLTEPRCPECGQPITLCNSVATNLHPEKQADRID